MITDTQREIARVVRQWEPGAVFQTEETGFSVSFTTYVYSGMIEDVKRLGATVSEFTRPNGGKTIVIDF